MTLPEDAPARNAKTEVWRTYAMRFGFVAPEDMGRDEIIENVEKLAPDFETPAAPAGTGTTSFEGGEPVLEKKGRPNRGAYFDV